MLMVCAIGTAWAGDVFTDTFTGGKATSNPAGFFTHSSTFSFNAKFADAEYDGNSYTNGLKMESATMISFTTSAKSTITIVESDWESKTVAHGTPKNIKLDGNVLAIADAEKGTNCYIHTITDVAAGNHQITRDNGECGLFLVKVEYTGAAMEKLTAPTITFDASDGTVTISEVENATKVTYTIDSTDPTAESDAYDGTFTAEDGVTVKAIAIGDNENYTNSDIASVLIILDNATIAAPVIKQFNGTVAITCETAGTTIEYSLDGENYTTYSRAFTLTENGTVYARAKRGDKTSESVSAKVTTISKGDANKTIWMGFGSFTVDGTNKYIMTGSTGDDAEGIVLTIDKTDKSWSSAEKITIGDNERTSIKVSNGAKNIMTLPEGMSATRITFYSYINSAEGRTSYWAEFNGAVINGDVPMGAWNTVTDRLTNPDVRVFPLNGESEITFTNTGEQLCFIVALDVIESAEPKISATSEIAVKATPFNKTSTATIKLTGSNLENNTYNVVMPEVEGLSISPATFTVADGAVEQTFTVTYTSDSDVESATANIVFVAGSTQALTVVNYMSHVTPYELTAISTAKTWDFSQLTANNNSTLYGSEGIKLNSETTPSSQEEVVYENFNGSDVTIESSFDGTAIAFKGEFPIRKNTFAQNGTIIFETTVPGKIMVDFSDTGSSGDNPAKRYLIVNNQPTAFYTQRTGSSNDKKTNCEISVPAGKVTISSTQAVCIYKISFTPADVPTITATITNAGYATFSSLFEVEIPDGVEAYYASASEGTTVTMTSIDGGVIPAGTGVVLKGAEGSYTMAVSNTGATLDGTNLLKANIAARTPGEAEYYTLAAGPKFCKSTGGTLAAGKAYLVIPSGSSARIVTMTFDGEATGISELKSVAEEGALYNLSGARVSKPTKGLYIQNGKKLIVK